MACAEAKEVTLPTFTVGDQVELVGMQVPDFNGKRGVVVVNEDDSAAATEGWVTVMLDNDGTLQGNTRESFFYKNLLIKVSAQEAPLGSPEAWSSYCDACNVTITSENAFEAHIHDRSHIRKLYGARKLNRDLCLRILIKLHARWGLTPTHALSTSMPRACLHSLTTAIMYYVALKEPVEKCSTAME
jgi:hypothetical protein